MSIIIFHHGVIGSANVSQKEFDRIIAKGLEVYEYLRPALRPANDGKLIVIDVTTKEYLITEDSIEERQKAFFHFHQRPVFSYKIGADDDVLSEGYGTWK